MEYSTDYGTGTKRNTVLYGFEKPVPESTASSIISYSNERENVSHADTNVKASIFRLTVLQAKLKQ